MWLTRSRRRVVLTWLAAALVLCMLTFWQHSSDSESSLATDPHAHGDWMFDDRDETSAQLSEGKPARGFHKKRRSLPRPKRPPLNTTVLWIDHYSEQMGRAASNYADLVALAKQLNRSLVEAFVHDSRMSGHPRSGHGSKSRPFSFYYDTPFINKLLVERGYRRLLTTDELLAECYYGWDVVVLFLYPDVSYSMMKQDGSDIAQCRQKAYEREAAVADCPALVRLLRKMPEKMGYARNPLFGRGAVVDLKRFRDPARLERDVFRGEHCAQIIVWAGQGKMRANFTLPKKTIIAPYELKHSPALLNAAQKFIRNRINGPYVGVHIRAEKEKKLGWSMSKLRACIERVNEAVIKQKNWVAKNANRRLSAKQVKVFFTTDLFKHGSDTLRKHDPKDREELLKHSLDKLKGALTIEDQGLGDNGAQAIIEMHVVAEADAIVVMGGGNFQEWIVSLFTLKHGQSGKVRRVCSQVREGWD